MVMPQDLRKTTKEVFLKMGMPDDHAHLAMDALVVADERGCETHGVSNMLRNYVKAYDEGAINPTPDIKIVREAPATATMDAGGAHGLVAHLLQHGLGVGKFCCEGLFDVLTQASPPAAVDDQIDARRLAAEQLE